MYSFNQKLKAELIEIKNEFEMGLLTPYERAVREHNARRFWKVIAVKMIK